MLSEVLRTAIFVLMALALFASGLAAVLLS
jgi:hypothetical protein